MKSLLFILALIFSFTSLAKIHDCYKEETQENRNECMLFERDKAVGQLMAVVTKSCANRIGEQTTKTEAIYPMLLDECMANELSELARQVSKQL
jgi:hypothetical protein